MDKLMIYKFLEFLIFSSYLFIIFLFSQILFLWMDIDKDKLKSRFIIDESMVKNNIIFVFFISIFFIMHEFFEGINLLNSYLYYEFFELLGTACVILLIYKWRITLKMFADKKSFNELIFDVSGRRKGKFETTQSVFMMNRIIKPILFLAFAFLISSLILFIPVSTLYFALIVGLLFIPPILALASTIIGASLITKEVQPVRILKFASDRFYFL